MIEKRDAQFNTAGHPGKPCLFTIFCFVFLELQLRWKKVAVIALLLSVTDVVEVLPWPIGIRTIVFILGLAVLIKIFTGKTLSKVLFRYLASLY